MQKVKHSKLYEVIHQQFATDRYVYGSTIVEANGRYQAMKKLNDYLATNPDGVYTALPCKSIKHVKHLEYIV